MSDVVSTLRARPNLVRLGTDGHAADAIVVRAQVPEVWDAVRIQAPRGATVLEVKRRALAELVPDEASDSEEYVVKLRGFEVLDETLSLDEAGVRDGSTLLITGRRRRPVR
ncbi:MAG TPA: hypothetical protein VGQ52_09595 [Gemmatimonadaceae bacterium]|jgi:hypothetical protein|nr:hypothetical protein [Gemmatimonadaceae bacterium]